MFFWTFYLCKFSFIFLHVWWWTCNDDDWGWRLTVMVMMLTVVMMMGMTADSDGDDADCCNDDDDDWGWWLTVIAMMLTVVGGGSAGQPVQLHMHSPRLLPPQLLRTPASQLLSADGCSAQNVRGVGILSLGGFTEWVHTERQCQGQTEETGELEGRFFSLLSFLAVPFPPFPQLGVKGDTKQRGWLA